MLPHHNLHAITRGCALIALLTCLMISDIYANQVDSESLIAPPEGMLQIISLADGSSLVGRILEVSDQDVRFESEVGIVTIPISKVTSIELVAGSAFRDGQYWFPNPNQTRLFFAPTGRMLGQGKGYFTDVYLFFPGVVYGITDNISLGGGVSLFPGVDFDEQLLYLMPKIGVSASSSFAFSTSVLLVRIPDDDPFLGGILFGSGTLGSGDKSLTFGIGYGFWDGELADKPAILLGGELRASRRIALVSENWVLPDFDEPLVSLGVRFFGNSLSVDMALINSIGGDAIFPGVPYVDFVYNF